MTAKLEILKCETCGNVVEIIDASYGYLECCSQLMKVLKENNPSKDNPHYANVEKIDNITKRVFLNHPMTEEHYIKMIEVISLDEKYLKRKFLKHTDLAEMTFKCDCKEGFRVRTYCSKDDLWSNSVDLV